MKRLKVSSLTLYSVSFTTELAQKKYEDDVSAMISDTVSYRSIVSRSGALSVSLPRVELASSLLQSQH